MDLSINRPRRRRHRFFRWRTCRHGTEQYWHGILDHHGIPGRRYAEAAQVGQELQQIGDLIQGSQIKPQIAIMQSYDTRFAFQVQPNNPGLQYEKHFHELYAGFYEQNIPLDVISEKDPLQRYKVVIVPALYVMPEQTAANLERFAADGGIVLFTPRTGVKDEDNAVVNMKLPGLVARMSGVEVEEYVSMAVDSVNAVQFGLPNVEESFTASIWADVLQPKGAYVVARYEDDYYAGKAAVTINSFGRGKVIYLGTMGDAAFYAGVTQWIAELANLQPLLETPAGVEAAERWNGDQRLLFILNHTQQEKRINLDGSFTDLFSGEVIQSNITIAPADLALLAAQ